jgi:hypothetical protein
MAVRMLWLAIVAWVLWVDQSEYNLAGGGAGGPIVAETAQGRLQRLAVTDNRGECEKLRQAAIRDAAASEGQSPGTYRAEHRYFCSRAEDVPSK